MRIVTKRRNDKEPLLRLNDQLDPADQGPIEMDRRVVEFRDTYDGLVFLQLTMIVSAPDVRVVNDIRVKVYVRRQRGLHDREVEAVGDIFVHTT